MNSFDVFFIKGFTVQTLIFNLYIFETQCRRPYIFETMNYVRTNNLSMKYQGLKSADCKDMGSKI